MANNTGVIVAVSGISLLLVGGIGLAVYSSSSKKAAEKAAADKAAAAKAEMQLLMMQQQMQQQYAQNNTGGGTGVNNNQASPYVVRQDNVWSTIGAIAPSIIGLFGHGGGNDNSTNAFSGEKTCHNNFA